MNNYRRCIRYESRYYGAVLVKTIRDQCSNFLFLLLFLLSIIFGLISVFKRNQSSEFEDGIQRGKINSTRKRQSRSDPKVKAHDQHASLSSISKQTDIDDVNEHTALYKTKYDRAYSWKEPIQELVDEKQIDTRVEENRSIDSLNSSVLLDNEVNCLNRIECKHQKETIPFPVDDANQIEQIYGDFSIESIQLTKDLSVKPEFDNASQFSEIDKIVNEEESAFEKQIKDVTSTCHPIMCIDQTVVEDKQKVFEEQQKETDVSIQEIQSEVESNKTEGHEDLMNFSKVYTLQSSDKKKGSSPDKNELDEDYMSSEHEPLNYQISNLSESSGIPDYETKSADFESECMNLLSEADTNDVTNLRDEECLNKDANDEERLNHLSPVKWNDDRRANVKYASHSSLVQSSKPSRWDADFSLNRDKYPNNSTRSTFSESNIRKDFIDINPHCSHSLPLDLANIRSDDWPDKEIFFRTLSSARSSISSSNVSLYKLSQEGINASKSELPVVEQSDDYSSLALHSKVKQLYSGCIKDRFDNLDDLAAAIREAGLVHSRIIIGIDYTLSNMHTGLKTFNGKCLHTIDNNTLNPYQEVIRILCNTLNEFDEDNLICAFGFGDSWALDKYVFKLNPASIFCNGFEGVLKAYNLITPTVKLGGPTNFAPVIREAIRIVQLSRTYTILILIADGQVVDEDDTICAIVEASFYPISIILVGVGDGPWDKMKEFDDSLPERKFDNFQFVNYHQVIKLSEMLPKKAETCPDYLFALMALMEIPDQYLLIKELGYLSHTKVSV